MKSRRSCADAWIEPVDRCVAWAPIQHNPGALPAQKREATLVLEMALTAPLAPTKILCLSAITGLHAQKLGTTTESLIISAPVQATLPTPEKNVGMCRTSLRTSLRAPTQMPGDLTDLGTLSNGWRKRKGRLVSTLPLLANFLDEPFEPSLIHRSAGSSGTSFMLTLARTRDSGRRPMRSSIDADRSTTDALRRLQDIDAEKTARTGRVRTRFSFTKMAGRSTTFNDSLQTILWSQLRRIPSPNRSTAARLA
jgi:hypothetical protein